MAKLGDVSILNINGNEMTIKDAAVREIVNEIIEAIGANNTNISERINDLHSRSFDYNLDITSNNDSEIANVQDGVYKLHYVTVTGSGDNEIRTLNNSAIMIQDGASQYLYKDGQLLSRTKIDNTWGSWIIFEGSVTSVNGQTGAVIIQENVKSNWATTDPTESSFIINKPDVTEIKTLYYNDTTGLLASSAYSLTFTESLDGYDLVKCYFRATNKNLSDSNIIPPAVLYIPLNADSQLLSGEYCGSVTVPYVDNDNRYAAYRCLISSDKTQFRVVSQTSLYGTAGTNISNATHGIYCYRIEAINTGNLIVNNSSSEGSIFVESDPVFLASPAYNITSTDISNWNNKLDSAPVISVNGQTGTVTIDHPVTSVDGKTGAVTIDHPVTSVNGQTGAVTISIPSKTSDLTNDSNFTTLSEVQTEIVGAAPEQLNTLAELADALNDDQNFAATVTNLIGQKYTKPSTGIPASDLEAGVIPTVPVQSVNGQTGAVSLALGDTNVIETIKVNNTALTPVSKAVNITVPTKVSDLTNDSNFTSNTGTITGITMNGISKGTSGVVNLGTVLTEHQDISGKVDKLTGMGLSSNDYTTTEKNKLAGINIGSLDSLTTAELNSIFS